MQLRIMMLSDMLTEQKRPQLQADVSACADSNVYASLVLDITSTTSIAELLK